MLYVPKTDPSSAYAHVVPDCRYIEKVCEEPAPTLVVPVVRTTFEVRFHIW